MTNIEKLEIVLELTKWLLKKLTYILVIVSVLWILTSWYEVVVVNSTKNSGQISEHNFFEEVTKIEVPEWLMY